MEPPRLRCIVVVRDGPSRRVGPAGLLIGRQGDCDIVALDPSVSRRHALVRLTANGVELVPLGKAPIDVNGAPVTQPHVLAHGDTLRVPGIELRVEISLPPPERASPRGFTLQRASARGAAATFGIAHSPFVIGGGEADDLIVRGWPAGTLHLHVAQGELFVELREGTASRNGDELEVGTLEPLAIGDQLACRGETFAIAHATHVATTAVGGAAQLPTRVAIEMLPRGGRVTFTVGGGAHPVYLADRRFDFVHTLLVPPAGHAAGEFISDDALRAVVWPRKVVSRPEINMLISRVRRDLVEAGLAGPRLVERAPGGGGTRLALAPGAVVEVSR